MSIKDVIIERFRLANLVAAVVVMAGLWMAYTLNIRELLGAIIGAGLTWLFENRSNKKE